MTDILVLEDGILRNAAEKSEDVFLFNNLYPEDVNRDGIVELPEAVLYPVRDGEGENYYHINWRQYDSGGASEVVYRSFNDKPDGWSLVLPKEWDDTVTVERTVDAGEATVRFFEWKDGAKGDPFLAIRTYDTTAGGYRAMTGNRFLLVRQMNTIYSAEFLKEDARLLKVMDEDTLKESFSLITGNWSTGDF